jgi:hypothetical protein
MDQASQVGHHSIYLRGPFSLAIERLPHLSFYVAWLTGTAMRNSLTDSLTLRSFQIDIQRLQQSDSYMGVS